MNNENTIVAVYGTLKANEYNNIYMLAANGTFLSDAITKENIFKMIGVGNSFPGVVAGKGKISAELYSVPKKGKPILDDLEGVPFMYKPVPFTFITPDNQEIVAELYVLTSEFLSTGGFTENCGGKISFDGSVYHWGS